MKYSFLLLKQKLQKKLTNNISTINGLFVSQAMPLTQSKKTIVHYHIQKSGGSSINHAFYCYTYNHKLFIRTAIANNLESDKFNNLNIDRGKAAFWTANRNGFYSRKGDYVASRNSFLYAKGKCSYLHGHYLPLKFINKKNSLSFTVIRDPLARLISKYKMDFNFIKSNISRSFPGTNLGINTNDPILNFIDNPEQYFKYLLENERRDFYGIFSTFSPRLDLNEAKKNLSKIDYIFKQDNLNEMFKEFLKKEKVLIPFYSGFLSRAKNSEKQKFKIPDIESNTLEILRERLEPEYKLISEYLY